MVELEELRNRVEGMQQSLDEANATIATKDVEVADLTKENVTLVESKTALSSALQQQKAKLRKDRSSFEASIWTLQDALMEKTKALADQAQVHEGNIADTSSALRREYTAALKTKTAELEELRNRVEGMQQSLDEANATVAAKDVEIADLMKFDDCCIGSSSSSTELRINKNARIRINKEFSDLRKDPTPYCSVGPFDDDTFKCKATLMGPEDSPYAGGVFLMDCHFPGLTHSNSFSCGSTLNLKMLL
jgi:DNA repair exonuclease SbcCD ATPase subunit